MDVTLENDLSNETLTMEDIKSRVARLVPDIEKLAAQCETDRKVPEESVAAYKDTGLHRAIQPKRYGGYEFGFTALPEMSFEIGQACTSTAWVFGLYMVHNWLGAQFPQECQDELWGDNRDAVISGSYAPIGKAEAADGGFRLSGRFPFSSGVPGADWNLCGAMLPFGPEGKPVPCFTLVPKSDYTIDWESWQTVGLSGTGSYDVLVDDVFIPAHRVLSFPDSTGGASPGANLLENPIFNMSLLTCIAFTLATPPVAAAAGALKRFVEENKVRDTHGAVVLGGSKIGEFQTVQKRVGEAAARIDAAITLIRRDIAEAEDEARQIGKTSLDRRLINRRSQSFATHMGQEAMNLIFDAVGGRSLQMDHPIQRAWRDTAAAAHHISMNYDAVMSMYGQHLLGQPLVGQY